MGGGTTAAAACNGRVRARQELGRSIRRRAAAPGSPVTLWKAGAWLPGWIHGICGSWAKRRIEVRERRREKGGEVRRPRRELAGAGRRWAGAGDGGIYSRPVERHQPGHGWRTLSAGHHSSTTPFSHHIHSKPASSFYSQQYLAHTQVCWPPELLHSWSSESAAMIMLHMHVVFESV
ncbi:uncharacterized protein [Triticum aestivum]|uniref:uncharacterized protein n=1 Tax=Triticum aestivum TaxID=4565 RepID=UPI001D017FD1|nr:uncharacterized protein LOC123112734 [Triticum aestivum]